MAVDLPEGYKMTELGPLPEEWLAVPLGDAATAFLGGATPSTKRPDYWGGDIPWTTSAHINALYLEKGAKTITKRGLESCSCSLVPKGNLVVGTRVGVGKVAINTVDVAISQDLTGVLVNKDKALPEFLGYALLASSAQEQFRVGTRGTTIKGIARDDLVRITVPLPPVHEQRKIAAVLSAVQEAREKTEAVIAALRELKKSLMKHLFTYGPVPIEEAEKVKLKDTHIGRLPEEWRALPLADVATGFLGGATPSTKRPDYWDGDIAWTTSAHINSLYLTRGAKGISKRGLDSCSSSLVPKGNLLIGTRVGVGKVAINMIDVAVSQDLTGVLVNKQRTLTEFLAYALLSSAAQRQFRAATRGTTIKGIPRDDLVRIMVPLPPLREQKKIAAVLSAVDRTIEAEEGRKQCLEQLFRTLLNDLMTARIRVNHLEFDG